MKRPSQQQQRQSAVLMVGCKWVPLVSCISAGKVPGIYTVQIGPKRSVCHSTGNSLKIQQTHMRAQNGKFDNAAIALFALDKPAVPQTTDKPIDQIMFGCPIINT